MRADEHYTFTQRILGILEPLDLETLKLQEWERRIREKYMVLDKAMNKSDSKMLTLNLGMADSRRDAEFLGLRYYLQACNYRQNDQWKQASDLLLDIIRKYGWSIQSESYARETARLENLIKDFENLPHAKEAVTVLNAGEWVSRVKTAQKDFEMAAKARDDMNAEQFEVNAIDACKELRKEIELLFKYMEVMNELTPNEEYQSIARRFNEQVEQFMSTAKARRTRLQNHKEEVSVEV
jgi:hypothetical protein